MNYMCAEVLISLEFGRVWLVTSGDKQPQQVNPVYLSLSQSHRDFFFLMCYEVKRIGL